MSDDHYSAQLRDISKAYYRNHIEFEAYRAKRKIILDKIDEDFNGQVTNESRLVERNDELGYSRTIEDLNNKDVEE